jgi:uncharacterized repeat protein (TIGR02543 family)
MPKNPKKFGAAMSSGYTDRVGQQFEGWFTDKALTVPYTGGAISKDTTVYAKWKHTWYVAFSGNGMTSTAAAAGNANGRNPYTISVPDGGTIRTRINESTGGFPVGNHSYENPKKNGFRFDGWHLDTSLNVPFDLDTPVETSLVLQAKWVTPITAANVEDIRITAPAADAPFQTIVPVTIQNGAMTKKIGYIGAVEWFNADGTPATEFDPAKAYTAKVSLTSTGLSGAIAPSSSGPVPTLLNPKELYYWTEDIEAADIENDGFHQGIPALTVNGITIDPEGITISGDKNKTGNVLSFKVSFDAAPLISFDADSLAEAAGKDLTVTVAIPESMKSPDKTYDTIVALYDKDGRLSSLNVFEDADNGNYTVAIPANAEGMSLKAFVWDNATIPLTSATPLN